MKTIFVKTLIMMSLCLNVNAQTKVPIAGVWTYPPTRDVFTFSTDPDNSVRGMGVWKGNGKGNFKMMQIMTQEALSDSTFRLWCYLPSKPNKIYKFLAKMKADNSVSLVCKIKGAPSDQDFYKLDERNKISTLQGNVLGYMQYAGGVFDKTWIQNGSNERLVFREDLGGAVDIFKGKEYPVKMNKETYLFTTTLDGLGSISLGLAYPNDHWLLRCTNRKWDILADFEAEK